MCQIISILFIVLGMSYFGGQFSFPRCCVDQLIVRSIDQYHQHSYGNLQTVFKNELLHIVRYNQNIPLSEKVYSTFIKNYVRFNVALMVVAV
jgi:hypothetical protein